MKARVASSSAAYHVDVAVIGAGVIGLAVARSLAQAGKEVLLLDRAARIGSETSSRNSEVIHAGLYYPPSSLKADFCVKGKQLLYEYCVSRNISHRQCGKLLVATHETQWKEDLPRLKQQAITNGVLDVKLFSREIVQEMEPQVDCIGALWSPSTGVLDSHSLMVSLLADAEHDSATLALNSEVQGGSIGPFGIQLSVDGTCIECDAVVNSAGLWADQVARQIHTNPDSSWQPPRQYFCKGNYFRLQGVKAPFQHLVYPIPEAAGGLGVHATLDWTGQGIKFGPDVEWLEEEAKPDDIDLKPNSARSDSFYSAVRIYWPGLPDDALVPDFAGIRPKLNHPRVTHTSKPPDFVIAGSKQHGVPGLVHLLGMESPGLTSSMAIAEYVKELVLRDI
jgi:L-2-hydroxyglutarate oxidase LhgO